MRNSLLILLSFSFIGCAHQGDGSKTVHFPYAPELLKSIQSNSVARAPASVSELEEKEEKSTRRVYFTTLYRQHLILGAHLRKSNSLASCPQFHHDKVEADSYGLPTISLYGSGQVEDKGREFFPELVFNNKFSLADYHESIQEEILTLCEEGVSDNYFKFDNLITHYAKREAFHLKTSAMESVLKIPIFANFYLIKMIQNEHELALPHPEEKLFIKMSQTHWFEHYVSEASRRRSNFLRNKMVKR